MDESINAVTPTEAPVTESAPVEVSTENSPVVASEKTEITEGGSQGDESVSSKEQPAVPYERFREVNEKAKKAEEYEKRLQELEARQNMSPEEAVQQQQLEVAKETLKKLGFVTKEEQEQKMREEKAANMFISECNRLEGKYDGKDGMPTFKAAEIAEYMDELASKGQYISDPETAYKLKNLDAIAEAKAKGQRSSAFSERQQGGMNQVTDERQAELEAASETGDFSSFLKKFARMPK